MLARGTTSSYNWLSVSHIRAHAIEPLHPDSESGPRIGFVKIRTANQPKRPTGSKLVVRHTTDCYLAIVHDALLTDER
jgi:hypothetical protein